MKFVTRGVDRVFGIDGVEGNLRLIQDDYENCTALIEERKNNKFKDGFTEVVSSKPGEKDCAIKLHNPETDQTISSFYIWLGLCDCFSSLQIAHDPESEATRNKILQSILDQLRNNNGQQGTTVATAASAQDESASDVDWAGRQAAANKRGANRFLKWTQAASYGERELLYDTCSKLWNENRWFSQFQPKVMVAGSSRNGDGLRGSCFSSSSGTEVLDFARQAAMISETIGKCKAEHSKCYIFAIGNVMQAWASQEEKRLANKSRFANNRSRGNGGGINAGELFGAILQGAAIGAQIGNAINGGGGGGGYSSGGGGANAACQTARSNAETCRARWQSLGGGTVSGTQAGSEYECYRLYDNAARGMGC